MDKNILFNIILLSEVCRLSRKISVEGTSIDSRANTKPSMYQEIQTIFTLINALHNLYLSTFWLLIGTKTGCDTIFMTHNGLLHGLTSICFKLSPALFSKVIILGLRQTSYYSKSLKA